jgi:carbonic anhydrase
MSLINSARDALQRLRDGNRRFVAGVQTSPAFLDKSQRTLLVAGQEPFAIILGCSDSRVPAELVFDQGFGDLFVIRIAGNIVAPSQIGSIEFAVEKFGTRLVLVLGHTQCGAIQATIDQIRQPAELRLRHLHAIVERIRPSIESLIDNGLGEDPAVLMNRAVRANVLCSVEQLRHGSAFLEELIERGELLIVGAEYSLETGVVDFFEGVPHATARADSRPVR